jgi:hypothetical protein
LSGCVTRTSRPSIESSSLASSFPTETVYTDLREGVEGVPQERLGRSTAPGARWRLITGKKDSLDAPQSRGDTGTPSGEARGYPNGVKIPLQSSITFSRSCRRTKALRKNLAARSGRMSQVLDASQPIARRTDQPAFDNLKEAG